MGFWIKRLNTFPPEGKSMVIVANHSSYMDIMLMFRMRKTPFVFVGKKELVKIPFFGYLYKRAAITVDRGSVESRQKVYESAHKVIEKGYSICIFPEKDYLDEKILLNSFKKGAFKLAIEHQLPVFPLVFYDCKRKFPWHTNFGYSGSLRIKALKLVSTNGMSEKNINLLSLEVYQKIETQLLIDPKKTAIEAIELWNRYKP
jgi:1-acyl-sn-glycerol-3-phosphate acyltransferase